MTLYFWMDVCAVTKFNYWLQYAAFVGLLWFVMTFDTLGSQTQPTSVWIDLARPNRCILSSPKSKVWCHIMRKQSVILWQNFTYLDSTTIVTLKSTILLGTRMYSTQLVYSLLKHLGYIPHIFRLSQLHPCDQEMLSNRFSWKFIELNWRAPSLVTSVVRWLVV